ncbi:MAG: CcoQ/FixQ family Cbb3-type cytochrome c oxidase assembly chaperone [Deferribacteraceae bacterium]|jgi:hypothetical protein|nr:CcoQ/FixQ family Cbb3-type cytochrome c oxidase assembly chaperone [Deferribacteraceae bacterium]
MDDIFIMLAYISGTLLCISMVAVAAYFFSSKRKDRIEKPKYDMLDDDVEK